ncbi:unnamed protein product [Arabidopsis arenosa]|uniref:Uncharacterized protein n=1 Tax=Arabidopsis arenosa TaxID=38785 RepID=A0A8S1ZS74_ARAAE|nr:unnamed protein product [Arabidopsis arenosa]
MGTSDLSIPGVFSSILLLQEVAARIHPGLCHLTITRLYENHKASETSKEEEAKNASSSLYITVKAQTDSGTRRLCPLKNRPDLRYETRDCNFRA